MVTYMRYTLIACVLCLNIQLWAQNKLIEGKVFYDITYPELSGDAKRFEAMLPKDATVYFKNGKSRVEMPNAAGKITTIADSSMSDVIILLNLNGKKFAMKKTAEDIKKAQTDLQGGGAAPKVNITKTDETKLIAGYTCKKAIIDLLYGEKTISNYCWYTDMLPKIMNGTDTNYEAIEGFMMEYTITQDGIKKTLKVRQVFDEKVGDVLFQISPCYRFVKSDEELVEIMNAEMGR